MVICILRINWPNISSICLGQKPKSIEVKKRVYLSLSFSMVLLLSITLKTLSWEVFTCRSFLHFLGISFRIRRNMMEFLKIYFWKYDFIKDLKVILVWLWLEPWLQKITCHRHVLAFCSRFIAYLSILGSGKNNWSKEEIDSVLSNMSYFATLGITPGMKNCDKCIANSNGKLKGRSWADIKYCVYNYNNRQKKKLQKMAKE